MNTINPKEIADLLREVVAGKRTAHLREDHTWAEIYSGHCLVEIDGWDLLIFNDCDEWDYVERAVSPDGRVYQYPMDLDALTVEDLLTEEECTALDVMGDELKPEGRREMREGGV